jgi:hypothetical protein
LGQQRRDRDDQNRKPPDQNQSTWPEWDQAMDQYRRDRQQRDNPQPMMGQTPQFPSPIQPQPLTTQPMPFLPPTRQQNPNQNLQFVGGAG